MSDPLTLRGAVDLGALSSQRQAQEKAASAPAGVVIDVTEATFQTDVIDRSMTVPVVIDLWASWCGPCKTLSPILEKLAAEYAGRWVLAKIDVDAEQRIAAAFQVQSIPSVFAVIQGQPLPLFQGAVPEPQAKQYIDAVLAEAAKVGVNGTIADAAPAAEEQQAPAEPAGVPMDPDLEAAYDAMESADWDAAEAAFRRILVKNPGDSQAQAGLANAALYRRVDGQDPMAVMEAADADPADVAKQMLAADIQAVNGDFADAFRRLIGCVRVTAGDDRAAIRKRLLDLFQVAGADDPRVAKARVELANALF